MIVYKRNCDNCNKYYEGSGSKFCCLECYIEWKRKTSAYKGGNNALWKRKEIKCIVCGKNIVVKRNRKNAKYCSRKCRGLNERGANNPSWNGGYSVTTLSAKIRYSKEGRAWRKAVLKRDNFKCQKYFISGGDLAVHHINNFADFPELRFNINNGIVLSKKAHKDFHKQYGNKNNTREQLNEFLQR